MPKIDLDGKKPIVMSVGGSMIVPNGGPDAGFIREFRSFITKEVKRGKTFVIVVGGGKTARHYIDAAGKVVNLDPEDLDWLGIHATRLNGHLMRTIFRDVAHPVVVKNPTRTPLSWQGSVLVGAGWKPGWSTDYVACRMAKRLGVKHVVNVSNVDYVYEEDPRKNPKAKPLEELDWKTYRGMVGEDWHPGKSAPFDPVATRFCQRHGMSVAIAAWNVKNLQNLARKQTFNGTLLS